MNARQFFAAVAAEVRRRAGLPEKLTLKVDPDWRKTRADSEANRERILAEAGFGRALIEESREMGKIVDNPPADIRQIHLLKRGPFHRKWYPAVIGIDTTKRRIAFGTHGVSFWNSDWLFGREDDRLLSWSLPVRFVSWLAALVLLPILWFLRRRWARQERETGLSRHSLTVKRALDGQLDVETAATLHEAMRNSRAHDLKMARRVPLEEAKAVLASCDCRAMYFGTTGTHTYRWVDDAGDQVADGTWYKSAQCRVSVFASEFRDRQATVLLDCHRSFVDESPKRRTSGE